MSDECFANLFELLFVLPVIWLIFKIIIYLFTSELTYHKYHLSPNPIKNKKDKEEALPS